MSTHFACINGCKGEYRLDEVIYRCPHCNSLLAVVHDTDALKNKSGGQWRDTFDARYRGIGFPDNSGIWSKREWVLPELPVSDIISLEEGYTSLFSSPRLNKAFDTGEMYVKNCGNSHTGSFKDLGMTVLVSQLNSMIKNGSSVKAVAAASTGDTSAALAAYAAHAGIPAIILLPKDKVSIAQLIQPVANGAHVLALDTDFDGCMRIVQELTKDNEIYLANSMNSLRVEGQKTVGMEVIQQLRWKVPDWFVIPGGNLGNVSALAGGIEMMLELGLIDKRPRIAVAQTRKADPLYRSYQSGFETFEPVAAQKTLASAIQIGNPVSYEKAKRALKNFQGVVESVTEEELSNAAAMADTTGLLADPHTGVALAALQKLRSSGTIGGKESVVVISTANGLKFIDFKVQYHEKNLKEVLSAYPNPPIDLPNDVDAVREKVKDITRN